MKKEAWIIIVLLVIVTGLLILIYLDYNEKNKLNSEITQLNADKEQLFNEKEQIVLERKGLLDQLDLLKDDVAEIYKTCITQNACKGHYPGIRWYCNNVGDETTPDTASHTCECDSSCELKLTVLRNI